MRLTIRRRSGAIQYEFSSPTQYMSGDLTGFVLNIDASTLYLDDGSLFNVQSSVLDFGVANGDLIGAVVYEPVPAPSSAVLFGFGALAVGHGVRRR